MSKLTWRIELSTCCGKMDFNGACNLEDEDLSVPLDLPDGTLLSITAEVDLKLEQNEYIFINGFQSWTHNREFTKWGKPHAGSQLPMPITKAFSIDRYGDYYFTNSKSARGIVHGESYCYFRKAKTFKLLASRNETLGYTIFDYDANVGKLYIKRDCAGLHVKGKTNALDLFWKIGTEDEVFDAWFEAMRIKPTSAANEKIAGYSSWYNRYQKISEKTIMEDLEGCKLALQQGDIFQIDDGWESYVGDWLVPNPKKFPSEMPETVKKIHDSGFRAGLWLAPFVAQKKSKILKKHPDWFLKGEDGKPWLCGFNWGGFYSLDIDNPEVVAYIEKVFTTVFDVWGFDLVKLDFLYGAAPFGNENETRAGRMIRGMKILRKACGNNLILGCGVPLMPAFGLVDYCRIGPDVGLTWNESPVLRLTNREHVSTVHSVDNTVFRRELNGRAFGNDPDVFFLRSENIHLSQKEKLKLATINALFGNVLLTSDNPNNYSPEALADYKYIRKLADSKNTEVTVKYIKYLRKFEISFYDTENKGKKKSVRI